MYGAAQSAALDIVPEITMMHETFNPSFEGVNPEPLAHNLGILMARVKKEGFEIGIATDGDADRIGAVDENGNFVDSHRIFSLLLKYLVEQKGMTGEVVKSFSVTQMVNDQCAKYGLTMHETPVGFKHICRLMTERDVLIGGEESGGLGVKGHIPERDGIFLGLLLCEMMAVRRKSLGALVQELMDEFGQHEFKRIDLHVTEKEKAAIMKKYARGVKEIAGYPVHGAAGHRRVQVLCGPRLGAGPRLRDGTVDPVLCGSGQRREGGCAAGRSDEALEGMTVRLRLGCTIRGPCATAVVPVQESDGSTGG